MLRSFSIRRTFIIAPKGRKSKTQKHDMHMVAPNGTKCAWNSASNYRDQVELLRSARDDLKETITLLLNHLQQLTQVTNLIGDR